MTIAQSEESLPIGLNDGSADTMLPKEGITTVRPPAVVDYQEKAGEEDAALDTRYASSRQGYCWPSS